MLQVRKKKKVSSYDPLKEKIIKELSAVLAQAGLVVRREKLKQGFGWRALSGVCLLGQDRLLFVDRKLPQDEQISFLINKIVQGEVKLIESKVPSLSDRLLKQLQACIVSDEEYQAWIKQRDAGEVKFETENEDEIDEGRLAAVVDGTE